MTDVDAQRNVKRPVEGAGRCGAFSEAPFKIKNSLAGHPLFEDNRLKRLLRRAPRDQVEIRAVQLHGLCKAANEFGHSREEQILQIAST
jgi:hypothetical protein